MTSAVVRWQSMLAFVVALAACANQESAKVCSFNGETYLCPGDTECATSQMLCVKPAGCGNGITDKEAGEVATTATPTTATAAATTASPSRSVAPYHRHRGRRARDDGPGNPGTGASPEGRRRLQQGLQVRGGGQRHRRQGRWRGRDDGNTKDADAAAPTASRRSSAATYHRHRGRRGLRLPAPAATRRAAPTAART